MNASFTTISSFIQNPGFAAAWLDALLKSFVVLAFAGVLYLAWGRAAATTRHLIWFLAVASLPLLPLLPHVLPASHRPLWSVSGGMISGNQISLSVELAPSSPVGAINKLEPAQPEIPVSTPRSESGKRLFTARIGQNWLAMGIIAWVAGMVFLLAYFVIGQLQLRRISRNARRLDAPEWARLLTEARETLHLRRRVALLQSPENVMPLTWGWVQPKVLMPGEAEQWPAERRRIVLLHELAHVKRWDCLTQFVARIACALYCFNPLAWIAARRMCVERERACDDLVLNGGCKASDYAGHLVQIARTFRRAPQAAGIAMARSSNLQQRVTAIVDASRARRLRPMGLVGVIIAIATVIFCIGSYKTSLASDASRSGQVANESALFSSLQDPATVAQLKHFVAEKIAQADASTNEPAPGFAPYFAAAQRGDWLAVSNDFQGFRRHAGQYEGSTTVDPRLHGTRWQAIIEVWGALDAYAEGDEKYISLFANDIINSIPPGSIYFGGTDPGRFLITGMQKSQVNGDPFFTLTQNALADSTYLDYLSTMYGGKIYTPTHEDSRKSFQEYMEDAQQRLQSHQLKSGEDISQDASGRVQVRGQVAVMEINGLLAKIVFDKNPDREFYVEESFPLDWMYPYLEPHGLIFKLDRQPLTALSDEVVQRDHDCWTKYAAGMIGNWLHDDTSIKTIAEFVEKAFVQKDLGADSADPGFVGNSYAHKTFSKERSSIAQLYVWRAEHAASAEEKDRMNKEADFAFRQAFALCPYSPEAVFRYTTFLTSKKREDDALALAETALKVKPGDAQFQNLVSQLKRYQAAK